MLRIWGRQNSSNVRKVIWCCTELDVPFERRDIGGAAGGLDTPEYRRLNPNSVIPTIEHDGFVLWESNAIVRYIASVFGYGTLYPENLRERADADRWMDWQVTTAQPALGPIFQGLIRMAPEQRDMKLIDAQIVRVGQLMQILDKHLAIRGCVAGDGLTMGDIPIGCLCWRYLQLPIERPELPNVAAYFERLQTRPAYSEHVMLPLT
jgi:glutathione S-transferase